MEDMVKDPNCAYCMQGELVAKFGYPVCEMKTGFLYVFKEQSRREGLFWRIGSMSASSLT